VQQGSTNTEGCGGEDLFADLHPTGYVAICCEGDATPVKGHSLIELSGLGVNFASTRGHFQHPPLSKSIMTESPLLPARSAAASGPRNEKESRPVAKSGDTARASDSIPVSVGPFAVLPIEFGRYRIERLLGNGAMGAVYLAYDSQLERQVALKVARVSASGSTNLIKRMETEAKSAARIDHPQICKVFDFGEIDGIRFISLQYIEGENLKTYLKRVGRRRDAAEAIQLILQIANALQAAHDKGVMHRDLKPENVMFNRKGRPVIMDFGLARRATGATDAGLTQGMIVGTAAYMSPEQAVGKAQAIDHRSDLYALGVMLFEMLTGEWPFSGGAVEVMGKKCVLQPPSPISINPTLSPELAEVCHKLIAPKKEDRYSSCAELVATLEAIDLTVADTLETTAAVEPSRVPSQRPLFEFVDDRLPDSNVISTPTRRSLFKIVPSLACISDLVTRYWKTQTAMVRMTLLGGSTACAMLAAILFFRNGDALVKVEIHADDVEVSFQNETLTVNDGAHQFKVKPGEQTLHIKSGDVEFDTNRFTLKRGENPAVTVELVDSEIIAKLGQREIGRTTLPQENASIPPDSAVSSAEIPTQRPTSQSIAEVPRKPTPASTELNRLAITNGGLWSIDGDELVQSDLVTRNLSLVFGSSEWSDYNFSFDAKTTEGSHGFKAAFHSDANAYYEFALGNYFNKYHDVSRWMKGAWKRADGNLTPGIIEPQRWYAVRLEVRGQKVTCYLDGIRLFVSEDPEFVRGRCGVSMFDAKARFRNFLVTAPDGTVLWKGLPDL
jgi:serine/threonine protein kinase